jgi:hypothetical protein
MAGAGAHHVQDQALGFARIQARATPDHLLVEQPALRGACHNNTIQGGFVKAFGEHGAVGHHLRLPRPEALEQCPAGVQRRAAVQGFGGNTSRRKRLRHGIRRRDRRRKQQRLAGGGVRLKRRQHLCRGVGRKQHGIELGGDKIPPPRMQRIKIGLEQHLDSAQVGQVPRLNHLHQVFLVDNFLKRGPQRLLVAALGRGRDAEHQRPIRRAGAAVR